MMPGEWKVLNEVESAVGKVKGTVGKIENFHLRFNRYRGWESRNSKSPQKITDYKFENTQFVKELSVINSNRERIIYYWNRAYPGTFRIVKGKTQWRLIVGLGVSHPAETSMKLHYIYGVPYIPGSALKGTFRHYWVRKSVYSLNSNTLVKCDKFLKNHLSEDCKENYGIAPFGFLSLIEIVLDNFVGVENEDIEQKKQEKNEKDIADIIFKKMNSKDGKHRLYYKNVEKNEIYSLVHELLSDQEFLQIVNTYQTIFGTQNQRGCFIFFDAYPLSGDDIKLERDVMTPHYGQYYNAKEGPEKFPTDTQSPNPINFVTWSGTFLFVVKSICSEIDDKLLDSVKNNLIEALSNYGIGAKTAVGYGRFEDLSDFTETYISDLEMKQARKERLEEEKRKQEAEKKEQEKLNAMPEKERILYQLKKCIEEGVTKDCHSISIEAFNKLDSLVPDERKAVARLLESMWRKEKKWSGTKGKQKNRVKKIREILEER